MFIQLWEEREERMRRAREVAAGANFTRGVYREAICPADEQWYKIVTSRGEIGTIHLPRALCDPGLEENLWKRLDVKDPDRQLKVI